MITFTCDRCERPLEVNDDLAGRKVKCPHCGDVNVVPDSSIPQARPGSPGRRPTSDRAEALGLPPDTGPEQRVLTVHPAMFRARPIRGALILLLVVGGAVAAGVLYARTGTLDWTVLLPVALAVAGLLWLAAWKVLTLDTRLTVTTKRTTARRGLLSKSTREIVHDQIKNITVTQTFLQRLLKVGTIGLDSSGQDQIEIVVSDIPNPDRLREVIDAYRNL